MLHKSPGTKKYLSPLLQRQLFLLSRNLCDLIQLKFTMIRSSSSTRVSDTKTQSLSTSPSLPSLIYRQSSLSPSPSSSESDLLLDDDLPSFHPNSVLAMRKKSRARFAQSSVHVIPFLLVLCGLVLWLFSKPVEV